jgi:hypothetical protein
MMAAPSAAPRAMRGQNPEVAGKEQAQRTRSNEILEDIKKLKDSYGQDKNRDAKAIPYGAAARLFQKMEDWVRDACVNDASQRVEKAAETIEKIAMKMEDRWKETNNKSYAQVVAGRAAGAPQAIRAETQSMASTEEKRIIVHLPDTTTAEIIGEQSREEIIERIREGAGAAPANRQVVAVRKLKSGDLAVYVDSTMTKKEMETTVDWANRIAPGAVVKKRTWPVLIHGVRVADYPQGAEEEHARRMEKENEKFHPGLKILGMRWLGRVEGIKDYAPLVVEVPCAEQANRMIREGVVIQYDLKLAETYDPKCRVTQCYKCQRYGHIGTACHNQQKCGHCGGEHRTDECIEREQATRRRCAACTIGEHASWAKTCPARERERCRAKMAQRTKARFYPTSPQIQTPPLSQSYHLTGSGSASQAPRSRGATPDPDGWNLVEGKRRRVIQAGRPFGAQNKPKQFEVLNNKSITELFSTQLFNTQSESSQGAGDAPTSNTEAGSSTQAEDMNTEE